MSTSTKASLTYNEIILVLDNPIALSTAISLTYSIILADIEEIKLKKHKSNTITSIIKNIVSTVF